MGSPLLLHCQEVLKGVDEFPHQMQGLEHHPLPYVFLGIRACPGDAWAAPEAGKWC